MIRIATFQSERTDQKPSWKEAEDLLNNVGREAVIAIRAYPTARFHVLVMIYEEARCDQGKSRERV